jgi:hypothetical protein
VSNLPEKIDPVDNMIAVAHNDSAQKDFEMARSNTIEVMQTATHAIEDIADIASQSQHPRAFEVLSQLLKTKLEASRELMTLQKDIREIDHKDRPRNTEAANTTVNQLFVGSTAELQRMLKDMKNGS